MSSSINFHSTVEVRQIYVNKLYGGNVCIHFQFEGAAYGKESTYLQEVLVFTENSASVIAKLKEEVDQLYTKYCMEEAHAEGMLDE